MAANPPSLRRGFKAEANRTAIAVRSELGLGPAAPLDARDLADHLGIPVLPLSKFGLVAPSAVRFFTGRGESTFSGVTVFDGWKRLIVYNDRHDEGRQQSNIAHELAHGLLFHEPVPVLVDGERLWDKVAEDEANWLAGALLISEEAALRIARLSMTLEDAAEAYGCSVRMMQFRLNMTGAFKRQSRRQQYA